MARNVTLALPDDLLREVKILAAEGDTSMSALMVMALQELVDQRRGYLAARDRQLATMGQLDLGGRGRRISRDELHER